MKMIIVVLALVAVALAAELPEKPVPQTIRSSVEQNPEGSYVFSFETENGISHTQTGELKEVIDADNKPQTVVVVRGSYQYTDSDGKVETIEYVADESGYHPTGDSIPKAVRR